jgi:hypothetical protein
MNGKRCLEKVLRRWKKYVLIVIKGSIEKVAMYGYL